MSTHTKIIKIFEDTLNWINTDKYLSDSVVKAKKNTQVFWEDDYPIFDQRISYDTEITISKSRSFEAAMMLNKQMLGN